MNDEIPQWQKVYRSLDEARDRLDEASTEEQFQAVGIICRETLISLAQIVYDPVKHASKGVSPSETDAKRMLDAFLSHELPGDSNEATRRQAKTALDSANSLQHRRTAEYRDAALCIEATTSVVNIVALLSGRTSSTTSFDVQVKFSYRGTILSRDEHLYLLGVLVINQGARAVNEFKLEFTFPNLGTIPRKWAPCGEEHQGDKRLIEIKPQDEAVSVREEGYSVRIIYCSRGTLFPRDQLNLSEVIGLRYRIDQGVYANLDDMPPLKWILYADNMQPKQGEISLGHLNNY